jgi:hypothetical protein
MDRGGVMGDPRMDRRDPMGPGGVMDARSMDPGRPMDRGMADHHRSTSMPGTQGMVAQRHSRSASRGMPGGNRGPGYHSLDREGAQYGAERDFMLREPRERSLDRDFGGPVGYGGATGAGVRPGMGGDPYGRRDRSLDRRDPMLDPGLVDDGLYNSRDMAGLRGDPMGGGPMAALGHRGTRLSPNPAGMGGMGGTGRDPYVQEMQLNNTELQRDLANLKKELELTNQKLGSSMHSIKTFWSPELKKERALRKEESAKYSLINDQLKLLNSENQVGDRSLYFLTGKHDYLSETFRVNCYLFEINSV